MKNIRVVAVLCMCMIIVASICPLAEAIDIKASRKDTKAVAINDFGWVTLVMNVNYTESYTTSGSSRRFNDREIWWTCTSSRNNAPVTMQMSPYVAHYNSVNAILQKFTLTQRPGVWGTDLFSAGAKGNSTLVTYPATTQNHGEAGYGITGGDMVAPYSNTLRINFSD